MKTQRKWLRESLRSVLFLSIVLSLLISPFWQPAAAASEPVNWGSSVNQNESGLKHKFLNLFYQDSDPSSFLSDHFSACTLDSTIWTFVDPVGDGSVILNGSQALLSVGAGKSHDVWTGSNNAARIMQPASNTDFEVEVKFDSSVTRQYQLQGIIIEQDSQNYLRFDFYTDGFNPRVFVARFSNGSPTVILNKVISGASAPMYMRVKRQGQQWNQTYSLDGQNWVDGASFSHALTVQQVGPFAGNAGSNPPAFTAVIDYFFNTAAPVSPEDGAQTGRTLTRSVQGGGTIQVNPDRANYTCSETVQLTAVADSGWIFSGWSGDLNSTNTTEILVMDVDRSVTATFQENLLAPVISEVEVTPGSNHAVVTWKTNKPANSRVNFGTTPSYELGAVENSEYVTGHAVTLNSLVEGETYHYQVTSVDSSGLSSSNDDSSFVLPARNTVIDVWYGDNQQFGYPGKAQKWINILGNVSDVDGISSLTYSLNGGSQVNLSIGPDNRRLAMPGDFNIDIAFSALTAGANTVVITATDSTNAVTTKQVTVNYQSGNVWPLPYNIDWSSAGKISNVGQVIDGKWAIEGSGVRPLEIDYDRIIGIGDETWKSYEIQVPITIHHVDKAGSGGASGDPGLGLLMHWTGHTDYPVSGWQPKSGYMPFGTIGWWMWSSETSATLQFYDTGVRKSFTPKIGSTYIFKMRSESVPNQGPLYSLKVWEQNQPEPANWDLSYQSPSGNLDYGSVLLLAHHVSATFGNVSVTNLATSQPKYQVTVNTVGGGVVQKDPNQADYLQGQSVSLTAAANSGWSFTGWSGDLNGNQNPASIIVDGNKNITATFEQIPAPEYQLTVNTSGSGAVQKNPDQASYTQGQSVTLTADADSGWAFTGWSGDLSGSQNPVNVTMNANKNITATFAQIPADQYQLTVNTVGSGVVQTDPAQTAYSQGQSVTLTAAADSGWQFTGWGGDLSSTQSPVSIVMDANKNITANFEQVPTNSPGIDSDDFNACLLNGALWTFVNPKNDSTVTLNGTQALISVAGGTGHDVWTGGNYAPRLMQPASDTDFEVEVKFESPVNNQYQMQGIIVEQDSQNYLRFDVYTDGFNPRVFAARVSNNSATAVHNTVVSESDAPYYMRVKRQGQQWTQSYSRDGQNWTTVASFSHSLVVNRVGPFAGNAGSNPPAHIAVIDYFFNTAAPVLQEDGALTGSTLTRSVEGGGAIQVNPDQTNYTCGETVQLTAVANQGWTFSGWSGDLNSTNNTETLVMNVDRSVTATFLQNTFLPLISEVQVSTESNQAFFTWKTDQPATSQVAYGTTTTYEQGMVEDGSLVLEHSMTITGLTPATTYHYQISSGDGNGSNSFTSDATFTTASVPSQAIVSDDFTSSELNTQVWTFVNPKNDSTVTLNGTQALISVAGGTGHDVWTGGNYAPRLMQPASDTDFEVEVKFESPVSNQYQMQGIIVEQDSQNYLRFDVYTDGFNPRVFAARVSNNSATMIHNTIIAKPSAPLYIRVRRQGQQWTQSYSRDGQNWTTVASFSHSLVVNRVGPFAGNAGSNPPAHTAVIDYFFNTAAPVVPGD